MLSVNWYCRLITCICWQIQQDYCRRTSGRCWYQQDRHTKILKSWPIHWKKSRNIIVFIHKAQKYNVLVDKTQTYNVFIIKMHKYSVLNDKTQKNNYDVHWLQRRNKMYSLLECRNIMYLLIKRRNIMYSLIKRGNIMFSLIKHMMNEQNFRSLSVSYQSCCDSFSSISVATEAWRSGQLSYASARSEGRWTRGYHGNVVVDRNEWTIRSVVFIDSYEPKGFKHQLYQYTVRSFCL